VIVCLCALPHLSDCVCTLALLSHLCVSHSSSIVAPLSMAVQLSEHDRLAIIRMRYQEGKTTDRIAHVIHCSKSTVSRTLALFDATDMLSERRGRVAHR
jgi:hypothetical protein